MHPFRIPSRSVPGFRYLSVRLSSTHPRLSRKGIFSASEANVTDPEPACTVPGSAKVGAGANWPRRAGSGPSGLVCLAVLRAKKRDANRIPKLDRKRTPNPVSKRVPQRVPQEYSQPLKRMLPRRDRREQSLTTRTAVPRRTSQEGGSRRELAEAGRFGFVRARLLCGDQGQKTDSKSSPKTEQ